MNFMKDLIKERFRQSIEVKEKTLASHLEIIAQMAEEITKSLQNKGKLLFFGNGGSAADSQHIAAEYIGRFQKERPSLAAIALTTDTSILTALGNDYGFDVVFARQIAGLANKNDIAVAISTSGNSKNVLAGVREAKKMGLRTFGFTGNKGGELAKLCDLSLIVPSENTARIQETHICVHHIICEIAESNLFKK